MPIRQKGKRGRFTNEASEFCKEADAALRPLFEKYQEQFSSEEMHYLVSTAFQNIILDHFLGLKPL